MLLLKTTVQLYPGCQRLFMGGFAARVVGLWPNTCRLAADETKLPVAREKKPLVSRVVQLLPFSEILTKEGIITDCTFDLKGSVRRLEISKN